MCVCVYIYVYDIHRTTCRRCGPSPALTCAISSLACCSIYTHVCVYMCVCIYVYMIYIHTHTHAHRHDRPAGSAPAATAAAVKAAPPRVVLLQARQGRQAFFPLVCGAWTLACCVCVRACVCVCVCVWCVCVYVSIYLSIYLSIYQQTDARLLRMYVDVYRCTYTHICTYLSVHR